MRIAVTGASGFVGRALAAELTSAGHKVISFVRRRPLAGEPEAFWDPPRGVIDENALRSCDAVVNLAGANIAEKRWNARRKTLLWDSRVKSTAFLARTLAELEGGPRTFLSASAVGYFGSRGDDLLDEKAAKGQGFLSDLCAAWEGACGPAMEAGLRVAQVRIGMVLGQNGGALGRMLPIFRRGLGGRLGDGQQWMSWIEGSDLARLIATLIADESCRGIYNAVAPQAVRNGEFTRTLAQVLGKPAFLPAPALVLRLMLGQMAEELLLASTRATPGRLEEMGFSWKFDQLDGALRHVLS